MSFINRYRLPIKLVRPQYNETQEILRKANGTRIVLSSSMTKSYDLVTDWLLDRWHERLIMALRHDNVSIEAESYIGQIVKDGNYEIEWPDFLDYPKGKGLTKVIITPYDVSNNNCGSCEQYSQVNAIDDHIGTVTEGEVVVVPVLENDAICCNPFEVSIITFDSTYVNSIVLNEDNTLTITMKNTLPTDDDVLLATYRVTCENGMYDEANIIANTDGSLLVCMAVGALQVTEVLSTSAKFTWQNRPGTCGYNWQLFLASDLGTPVQEGTVLLNSLEVTGLTPSTNYVLFVIRDCCDGNLSDSRNIPFTTQPAAETEICGNYTVEFIDGCGYGVSNLDFQYLDCNDTYIDITLFHSSSRSICMKQTSPNAPVYYSVINYNQNGPEPCNLPYTLNVTYNGPC